jgi:hypothetical protein
MSFHRHPYRTAAQKAADEAAMQAILWNWGGVRPVDAHPAGCNCWLCCANADDDFTPDMGDPHAPNDERGWWLDVNWEE